jgi:hypothetical protein
MRMIFIFFSITLGFVFASDLNVYDAQGNFITKTSRQDAPNWLKNNKEHRKIYIASKNASSQSQLYKTVSPRKTIGKKYWYEVDWNQGVKLCPQKNIKIGDGTWIVNGAARIDSLNCVYVEGSPYTRSILVLYSRDQKDLTEADSSWILVNQTIVELAGKTIKVPKALNYNCTRKDCDAFVTEELKFENDLIVDKTEMRFRDAIWLQESVSDLRKIRNIVDDYDYKKAIDWFDREFYPSVNFNEIIDYPVPYNGKLVMLRSVKDGLDVSWKGYFPLDSVRKKNYDLQIIPIDDLVSAWDLKSNGYRIPTAKEWIVLTSGGSSRVFAWGDSVDEKSLSREMNIWCSDKDPGLYPVKQYAPNGYGLYDVYGNAEERVFGFRKHREYPDITLFSIAPFCGAYEEKGILPVCRSLRPYACAKKGKPRLQKKYDSFYNGFVGMRAVRILE